MDLATSYYFEWGSTTSYGQVTVTQSAGSNWNAVAISANLNRCILNTTYHFCLVATNSAGTTYGSDTTFTTTASKLVTDIDFNGDGKADILWRHKTSGMLYIWLMNGITCVSGGSPGTVGDRYWQIVAP